MKWLNRISINARLFTGFGLLIVLLVIIIFTGRNGIDESQTEQGFLIDQILGNVYDLPALRANLNAERLAVAVMLESDSSTWRPWLEDLKLRKDSDDQIINRLIMRFRKYPAELRKLNNLTAIRDLYVTTLNRQLLPALAEGKKAYARQLFIGENMADHQTMREIARELEVSQLLEAQRRASGSKSLSKERGDSFALFGGAAVLIALVLAAIMKSAVSSYVGELDAEKTALAKANRALKMINECNSVAIHSTSESQLLKDTCRTMVREGGYQLVMVGYAERDADKSLKPVAFAGKYIDLVEREGLMGGGGEKGDGAVGNVIRTGKALVFHNTLETSPSDSWQGEAAEKGLRSSAILPLPMDGGVYGVLMVHSAATDAFDEDETRLLSELADDMAYATMTIREREARSKAEAQARAASFYSRSLLEASLDPLVTISLDGKVTDVNEATERITGRGKEELVGSDFSEFFTEPARAKAGYERVFREGSVQNYELEVNHKDGRTIPVACNAAVYRDEEGRTVGVFAAGRDMSENKEAAARLESERRKLNEVIEVLPVYVALMTPDYRVIFSNRLFRERFGEPEGKPGYEFLFGKSRPRETYVTIDVLKAGSPVEWEWTGPANRRYHVFTHLFKDAGGSDLILETGIDVTDRGSRREN